MSRDASEILRDIKAWQKEVEERCRPQDDLVNGMAVFTPEELERCQEAKQRLRELKAELNADPD